MKRFLLSVRCFFIGHKHPDDLGTPYKEETTISTYPNINKLQRQFGIREHHKHYRTYCVRCGNAVTVTMSKLIPKQ